MQKNKYLIFSQARSGSTTIAACLTKSEHGSLTMIQEPTSIKSGDKYLIQEELGKLNFPKVCPKNYFEDNIDHNAHNSLDYALRDKEDCFSFLDDLYSRFEGVKHIWNNNSYVSNTNIINYAKEKNIPIVFLYRNNQFEVAKSVHIVRASKISQLSIEGNDEDSINRVKERLNQSIIPKINFEMAFTALTRAIYSLNYYWRLLEGHQTKLISYEDFYYSGEKEQNLKDLCDFINCDFDSLKRKVIEERLLNKAVKQCGDSISNNIPNINEYHSLYEKHLGISNFRLK